MRLRMVSIACSTARFLSCGERLLLHATGRNVPSAPVRQGVFGEPLVDDRPQIAAVIRAYPLDHDAIGIGRRIGLADLGVG